MMMLTKHKNERQTHTFKQYWLNMNHSSAPIKAVFFDWELTLARVLGDVSNTERLAALFQSQGLPFTLQEIEQAWDVFVKRQRPLRKAQSEQEITAVYAQLLKILGHQSPSQAFLKQLYNGFAHLPTLVYDDTKQTLNRLQTMGIHMGIISNHTASVRPIIEKAVCDYIDPENIFISQEMGTHKPSPYLFQCASQAFELDAQNCLFVGDSLEADAIGAVQQGGFRLGLWLDRYHAGKHQPLPPHVIRITRLADLFDYL